MRITCTATSRGNVYHFYRNSDDFYRELKPLIPLLIKADGDVLVGSDDETDPALLLSVGPMEAEVEAELLRRARRFLAPGCRTRVDGH